MSSVLNSFSKLLSDEQKEHWRQVSQKLLNRAKKDPHFLNKVVTEWVSQQQRHNHHGRKKRIIVGWKWIQWCWFFFDSTDIVLFEYARREETVNQKFYKRVLDRLRENAKNKSFALWRDLDSHRDNATTFQHRQFGKISDFCASAVFLFSRYSPVRVSIYFPNWTYRWKGRYFTKFNICKQIRRRFLISLRKKISRTASIIGNIIGVVLFSQMGTFLKKIHRNNRYVLTFWDYKPRIKKFQSHIYDKITHFAWYENIVKREIMEILGAVTICRFFVIWHSADSSCRTITHARFYFLIAWLTLSVVPTVLVRI